MPVIDSSHQVTGVNINHFANNSYGTNGTINAMNRSAELMLGTAYSQRIVTFIGA